MSVNGEKLIDSLNLVILMASRHVVKTLVVNVRNHEGLEILLSPQKDKVLLAD